DHAQGRGDRERSRLRPLPARQWRRGHSWRRLWSLPAFPHLDRHLDRSGRGSLPPRRGCRGGASLIPEEKKLVHVKTKIERPDPALVAELAKYGSATIHEAQGRLGALSSRLKPVDRAMSLCGPAFTVKCAPRDNIMLQVAISYAKPGDVIVVSAGEYEEAGSFGDVLANACLAKGIAGLVTDTGVRDTAELIELGFPVFSLSTCIKGTVKETLGQVNDPVIIGGEIVHPGDVIRGDA